MTLAPSSLLGLLKLSATIAVFAASTAACSAETTAPGGGAPGDGEPAPAPTAPAGSSTAKPPADAPTTPPPSDTPPPIDKTVHFELDIDGETITPDAVTVKIDPATSSRPARVVLNATHEQQLGGPFTSTATFTLTVDGTETGKDACGKARSASYFFKDTDGALRGLGTTFQGGACSMNVLANQADGFSSGTASGTLGGVKVKTFTVSWGQNLPK